MRSYILTDHERNTLDFYFKKGLKLNGFRQMKYEAQKLDLERLEEDLILIKKFLED